MNARKFHAIWSELMKSIDKEEKLSFSMGTFHSAKILPNGDWQIAGCIAGFAAMLNPKSKWTPLPEEIKEDAMEWLHLTPKAGGELFCDDIVVMNDKRITLNVLDYILCHSLPSEWHKENPVIPMVEEALVIKAKKVVFSGHLSDSMKEGM